MTTTKKQIESLIDALDDVPVEPQNEGVASLAAKLRAKVRFADATDAYAEELARLEAKKHAAPNRSANLAAMKQLLARVPAQQHVAMHFLKYESASDDELAELVRALEHLLDDDEE